MESGGIMAEIKGRLSSGESAQVLIAEGYKSGSVYKARWQMRKEGKAEGKGVPPQRRAASLTPAPMAQERGSPSQEQAPQHTHDGLEGHLADLQAEVAELSRWVEQVAPADPWAEWRFDEPPRVERAAGEGALAALRSRVDGLAKTVNGLWERHAKDVADRDAWIDHLEHQVQGQREILKSLAIVVANTHWSAFKARGTDLMSLAIGSKPWWTAGFAKREAMNRVTSALDALEPPDPLMESIVAQVMPETKARQDRRGAT